jgi:AbiTii
MNPNSIVATLQRIAVDPNSDIIDVIRKARFTAQKLSLSDFVSWTSFELHGYPKTEGIPSYRVLKASVQTLKVIDDTAVWKDYQPKGAELLELLTGIAIRDSATQLALFAACTDLVVFNLSDDLKSAEVANRGDRFLRLAVSPTRFAEMLEHVRQKIIDWAVELEHGGVSGGEISFTPTEIAQAGSLFARDLFITNTTFNDQVKEFSMKQQGSDNTQSKGDHNVVNRDGVMNFKSPFASVQTFVRDTAPFEPAQKDAILNKIDALQQAISDSADTLQKHHSDDIRTITAMLETFVKTSAKPETTSNKRLKQISGEGLIEAAKGIASVAPAIFETAKHLVSFLNGR